MIDALLESGISPEQIEAAVRVRALDLSHVDHYILLEPGPRSERTIAQFAAEAGPRGSIIASIYHVLGVPAPDEGPICP
jgi:hypothetical protein